MAFEKEIIGSTQAPAKYHRIPNLAIDFKNKVMRGVIASFYTKAARMANAGALASTEFNVVGKNFPFTDADEAVIRAMLNIGEGQDLLNIQFFFDGTDAHGTAAISVQVAGNPFNSSLQFKVEKAQMPVDFLKSAYEIMAKEAPFNDAVMV